MEGRLDVVSKSLQALLSSTRLRINHVTNALDYVLSIVEGLMGPDVFTERG